MVGARHDGEHDDMHKLLFALRANLRATRAMHGTHSPQSFCVHPVPLPNMMSTYCCTSASTPAGTNTERRSRSVANIQSSSAFAGMVARFLLFTGARSSPSPGLLPPLLSLSLLLLLLLGLGQAAALTTDP